MAFFKITAEWNQNNLGKALNVFYFRNSSGNPTDLQLRTVSADYLLAVYGPLLGHMDDNVDFLGASLVEVNSDGETVRVVGSITANLATTQGGSQLALPTAGSMFARTNTPKVRGSKRFPGIGEAALSDGLFTNPLVNALVNAAIAYVSTRGSILTWIFQPGVISTALGGFADFAGQAVVTNIPGTQVTRKPLRGA